MKTRNRTIAFASALVLGVVAYTVTAQLPGPGQQPPHNRQGPPGGAERGERDRDSPPPPHPTMTALDVDNDSVLSAQEIANAVAALKKLDKDGAIDKDEAEKLAEALESGRGGPSRDDGRGGRPGGPNDDRPQRPQRPQR